MRVQQRALCACTCVCERLGGKCVGSGCRLFLFCFFSIQLGGLRRRMLCEEALLHMCVCVCMYMFVAVCAQGRVQLRVYFQSMNVNETFSSQTAAGNWLQLCRSYRATASGSLSTHTHVNLHTRRHQM